MDADIVTTIIAYEQDKLTEAEEIALFQRLIDSGAVWRLQGHYGRQAKVLIEAGLCKATREADTCGKCGATLQPDDYSSAALPPLDCVGCRSIY